MGYPTPLQKLLIQSMPVPPGIGQALWWIGTGSQPVCSRPALLLLLQMQLGPAFSFEVDWTISRKPGLGEYGWYGHQEIPSTHQHGWWRYPEYLDSEAQWAHSSRT